MDPVCKQARKYAGVKFDAGTPSDPRFTPSALWFAWPSYSVAHKGEYRERELLRELARRRRSSQAIARQLFKCGGVSCRFCPNHAHFKVEVIHRGGRLCGGDSL